MTCKLSLCKSLRELLKHHLASVFAVCLIFFIKTIAFFLNVQSYATKYYTSLSDREYILERVRDMTLPGYGVAFLVGFIGIFLAFDFFRYLHSKKQVDFYDSLPTRRKEWFAIRILGACLIFFIPFILNLTFEMVILSVFHYFKAEFLINTLWNLACMSLIFLAVMLTGVLAMIMTGHPIVALFGFGVFSAYAPILLQFLFPAYASQYFDTYVSSDSTLQFLNYVSPIGAAVELIDNPTNNIRSYIGHWSPKVHYADFIAILILIVFVGVLAYTLFLKRPSESAGRAMAFTKCNTAIRILLVIPLTLYVGLYLSQVTTIAEEFWMVFGFIIGTILLHGIIESIFQFDIHGLWSHKKQMIYCFIVSIAFALVFWLDLFGYDKYIPKLEQLESIVIDFDGYYDLSDVDGITGDYLDDAYQLVKTLIPQSELSKVDEADRESIHVEYRFKNGFYHKRYYFVDMSENAELFDKIYASREYKDDICMLYTDDWSAINQLTLTDGHVEVALHLTDEERDLLFETYIAEYTPFTYSQKNGSYSVAFLRIDDEYPCYIYPEFAQTIALLNKYVENDESIKHFGTVSESPLDKYTIHSIDIFTEDHPISISDDEEINELKNHIDFYNHDNTKYYDYETNYEVQVTLITSEGTSYASGIIPKDVAKNYMK